MKRKRIFLKSLLPLTAALLLCWSAALSSASTIDLPQTGQTTCYDSSGAVISCANTGQDGDWLAGVIWPNPRFVSGTGTEADCMVDTLTGLMWPKNGNLSGGTATWHGAFDIVDLLNLCGHNDWRLPNVVELRSLINDEEPTVTWLSAQGFNNVLTAFYWSSSTYVKTPSYVWLVYMDGGTVESAPKSNSAYVWPVRAGHSGSLGTSAVDLPRTGQTTCYPSEFPYDATVPCAGTGQDGELQMGAAWPSPRYSVSGECVTDNLTGLMWTKNANRFETQSWQAALDSANGLNLCGFTDWRLPNVNELRSAVDYSNYGPALPDSAPFTNVQLMSYWSSSTYVLLRDHAWSVYMGSGGVYGAGTYGARKDTSLLYVWPVRAGQFGDLIISPSNLTAKATSASKIVLGWKDNSDNETGFKLERKRGNCDSANSWAELPASIAADAITYTNSGLTANTTYSYRLRAYNASRNSDYSNCASAKTALVGTPNAPTNLKATSNAANKVTLTWADVATNETRVEIYRKMGAGTFALLHTIESANVESYADTTATGNVSTTAYSYYIQTCNATGCSPATNTAVVPFRPTAPKATPSAGKINFKWSDKSTNEKGFQVYRKDGACSSANAWSLIKTTVANSHAYSDTAVTSGNDYSYMVRAFTQSAAPPYATGYSLYTGCVSAVAP